MTPGKQDLTDMPLPKGAQWVMEVSWLAADFTPPAGYAMELAVYPSEDSTDAVFALTSAITGTTTLLATFTAPNATSALVELRRHQYRLSFTKIGSDTLPFIYGALPTMAWR